MMEILCFILKIAGIAIVAFGAWITFAQVPFWMLLSIFNRRKLYSFMQYYKEREETLWDIGQYHEKIVEQLRETGSFDDVSASYEHARIALRNGICAWAASLCYGQCWFALAIMPNVSLFGNRRNK